MYVPLHCIYSMIIMLQIVEVLECCEAPGTWMCRYRVWISPLFKKSAEKQQHLVLSSHPPSLQSPLKPLGSKLPSSYLFRDTSLVGISLLSLLLVFDSQIKMI